MVSHGLFQPYQLPYICDFSHLKITTSLARRALYKTMYNHVTMYNALAEFRGRMDARHGLAWRKDGFNALNSMNFVLRRKRSTGWQGDIEGPSVAGL
jgi:hypothetical protein